MMFLAGMVTGIILAVVVSGVSYYVYKSEKKDSLIADELGVEFNEGISLGKKEEKK